ncbi:MFS transporter [Neisseriaceae bacterium ESL0693]|nr:MFS transporter [Neisseriaceae bacterium ESL0693]
MTTTNTVVSGCKPPSAKVVMAAVAGNALEFYDFIIYSFFATYIGQTFFPTGNELTTLLASVAVYGVGFFTRPLGGFLIGTFADRAGRKAAMILTVALITIGTLGLAATPSYEQIGMAAPIIVLVARLLQGLGLGGEVGPVSAMLVEIAPPDKRAFYASWQMASQGIAVFVGGLVGILVSWVLTAEQLLAWGWRLPFILSILLVPIALYIRRALPETMEAPTEHTSIKIVSTLLSKYTRFFILGILIMMSSTISVQVGNYMTTYALTTLKLNDVTAQIATAIGGMMLFASSLVGGYLADKYNRKNIIIWPRMLLTLIIVPLFYWLDKSGNVWILIIVTMCITWLSGMSGAVCLVSIPEMMPKAFRATGVSLIYAIGATIFGGTTQFIITWLIPQIGPVGPAYYVMLSGALSLVAMWMMPETKHNDISE